MCQQKLSERQCQHNPRRHPCLLAATPLGKGTGLLTILLLPWTTSATMILALTWTWHAEGQRPPRREGNSLCSRNGEHEPRKPTPKWYSAVSIVHRISCYHSHTSNANISLTKYLHNFYNQTSNRQMYLFWRFLLLFHYLAAFHHALFTADKLTSRTLWLTKASIFSILKDSS